VLPGVANWGPADRRSFTGDGASFRLKELLAIGNLLGCTRKLDWLVLGKHAHQSVCVEMSMVREVVIVEKIPSLSAPKRQRVQSVIGGEGPFRLGEEKWPRLRRH